MAGRSRNRDNGNMTGRTGVVIVAAGRGERAGQSGEGPKQYRRIGGVPVIRRTVEAFAAHPGIDAIVVCIHRDDATMFDTALGELRARCMAVTGGATRQESTLLGLRALRDLGLDTVLVHDGVRPFVDGALISRVIAGIDAESGSLPALPVSDTLKKEAEDGLVGETVPRQGLHAAQTPQGFAFDALLAAHEDAHARGLGDFTDDAAIAEWAGLRVRLVPGSADNSKITWARDLDVANERMGRSCGFPDVRTGNGYDVHSFGEGDHVTLCGVAIPFPQSLSGHSDADVGLHALTDALLATCGAGDIGTHFPPSDMKWKGAASHIFVAEAVRLVKARGGRIANADVTLIAEAPRVGPHRAAMVAAMAAMLGIAAERVSVKATTNETLGFIGRREGIAAIATATVVYPGDLPE